MPPSFPPFKSWAYHSIQIQIFAFFELGRTTVLMDDRNRGGKTRGWGPGKGNIKSLVKLIMQAQATAVTSPRNFDFLAATLARMMKTPPQAMRQSEVIAMSSNMTSLCHNCTECPLKVPAGSPFFSLKNARYR